MADEIPGQEAAAHNVFISFSSRDRRTAKLVCKELERLGLRCWISSRDVHPGENYQSAITKAIKTAKVVIFLFTSHANESDEIKKEISLASRFKAAVIPVRVEDVSMDEAFSYELATRQWVDAFKGWEAALQNLAESAHAYIRLQGGDGMRAAPPADRSIHPVRLRELEQISEARSRPPDAPPAAIPVTVVKTAAAAAQPTVAPQAPAQISAEHQDVVRSALAVHLGPIAKVLVRRHAGAAASTTDLVDRLAAEIEAEEARAAFRRDCRAALAPVR